VIKELYTAAMGMMSQQTRLEVTSNNIANANTVGYKKDSVFERNLIDSKANLYNITGSAEQSDPPIGSYINMGQGPQQNTTNPLDFAIDGNGFFLLKDEQGREFLTRSGDFKLDEEGYIISSNGKYVQTSSGPLNLVNEMQSLGLQSDGRFSEIKVNQHGEIFVNNITLGTLRIVDVENEVNLEKISSSDFILSGNNDYFDVDNLRVNIRQGWLENSNVNVIEEMVELIKIQRNYEANSKVITTNDSTLEESIRTGRFF